MPIRPHICAAVLLLLGGAQEATAQSAADAESSWPVVANLSDVRTRLDSTRVLPLGEGEYASAVYRHAAMLTFEPGVSTAARVETFRRQQLTVVGVSPDSTYFVQFTAVGSMQELVAKVSWIRAEPEIALATILFYRMVLEPVSGHSPRRVRVLRPQVSDLPLAVPPPRIVILPRPKKHDD